MSNVIYRKADHGDADAVEELVNRCFGPGRFAKSAYRLREGVHAVAGLSFVAAIDVNLVGTIQYWPISIGGTAALLLGPLAVDPARRGLGIGQELMRLSLAVARDDGHQFAILVGDEPYYGKVGFKKVKPGTIVFPGPVNQHRLLGLSLNEGVMDDLKGAVLRARLDDPHSAIGAGLASPTK